MKKSVIALAVAAAIPVAAQADATLSGSVKASYVVNTKALDIDSDLDISSTEVLANGMTASASFDVGSEGDSGEASLEGDFGTLTVGSGLDRDGAFQSGVLVPGTVEDLYDTSDSASTSNAIHYSGSWADLSIQAQVNASTDASGATTARVSQWLGGTADAAAGATSITNVDTATGNVTASNAGTGDVAGTSIVTGVSDTAQSSVTQIAATYEFNGITLGYATVNGNMTSGIGSTINKGSAVGATYSFGGLSVGYSKASTASDPVMVASYKATYGEVDLSASVYDWGQTGVSNTTHGSASYTLDGLTVTLAYDSDKGASASKGIAGGTKTGTVGATYVSGDMTAKVGTEFDGSTDYSVSLSLGNADLSLARDDSKSETTAKYSVAF